MKNDDSKSRYLSYREGSVTALVITVLSLFMQWFIWFLYEKADYAWGYNLFTPLVLCMMYHFVQLDSGKNGNFSKRFFFIFSVAVPMLFGIALTVVMRILNPDMSIFDPEADYGGTVRELIAVYAGRFIYTSVYLLIFALIDIPILRSIDEKGSDK